ncbi:MAG: hypothetical protein JWM81_286 [Candidatus Saccharibacteria bacterium]|nr:hypothetical protein [Candidatus Saccharibacteria bacterium]
MARPQSPCEYGTCPSDQIRAASQEDPVKQAEMMAGCARALARIIQAEDYAMLIATDAVSVGTTDQEGAITFGPSPCPLMTPYSFE